MPALSRPCRRLMVVALALSIAGTAAAQRLDLDPGGSFRAPDRSVDRLAKQLRENAKGIEAHLDGADGPGGDRLRAQAKLREFAALLLEAGAGFGEAGSVHLLIARRLGTRLSEMDAAIASAEPEALAAFVSQLPTKIEEIPRQVETLDTQLASIFRPLAALPAATPDPWPITRLDPSLSSAAAMEESLAACARVEGVTKEAIDVLRHAAGAPEAPPQQREAIRQTIVQSCRLITGLPRWLKPEMSQRLAAMFDRAATHLLVPQDAASSRADLVRLAILGDIIARLEATRLTAKQAKAVRSAIHSLIEATSPGENGTDDAAGAFRRGLLLVSEYDAAAWNDARRLVREVRPVWKHIEMRGKGARDELIDALSALEPRSPALSDPGFLGALELLRACLDDARDACVISEWLAGSPAPGASADSVWRSGSSGEKPREAVTQREDRTRRTAGVRILALGPKLRDDETREAALAEFRDLAGELRSWMPATGESDLRAAVAAPESPLAVRWRDLTGGNAKPLAEALDFARGEWLAEWAGVKARPGKSALDTGPLDPRLLHLPRRLIGIASDAATVTEMIQGDGATGIRAWPGFELPTEAAKKITQSIQAELSRAGGHIVNGAMDDAEASLGAIEPHATVLGALADLERRARAHGVRRHPLSTELAFRPAPMPALGERLTPAAWMASVTDRETVAVLCRAVEEFAELNPRSDRAASAAMLKRAATEAERLRGMFK